jgi:predicted phosphodiesterase
MATVIIGDVHGCLQELAALLAEVGRKTETVEEIIFVGDLVDKGPHSVMTLKYLKQLSEDRKVTIVEGNHENKNFRFWKKVEAGETEKALEMKGSEELSQIMTQTNQELRDWLRDKVVPYVVRPESGVVVVHGGITPKVTELPADPNELTGKNKKRALRSMYIRYVDDAGSMIEFGKEAPEHDYWAEIYDGRFGHVYFGHQPFLDHEAPVRFEHATALDLGCVHGGHLAAAVLHDDGNVHFETVKAGKVYCDPILVN